MRQKTPCECLRLSNLYFDKRKKAPRKPREKHQDRKKPGKKPLNTVKFNPVQIAVGCICIRITIYMFLSLVVLKMT